MLRPMITGMEHAALSVSNLERSLQFYCELLGMDHVRTIESTPEKGLGRINGLPESSARIAHLESGTLALELFEYTSPRGREVPPDRTQADLGFIHIAFISTSLIEDTEALVSKGVELVGEPVEYRPGVWVVYFRGPDGEVCELRQS